MKIELRHRKHSSGNQTLYLEFYEGRNKRCYESLNLFLVPERTEEDRRVNEATLALAQKIKAERILGIERPVEDDEEPELPRRVFCEWLEQYLEHKRVDDHVSDSHVRTLTSTINILKSYLAYIKRPRLLLSKVDKNFNRCYPYFSAIMPYESPEWEKQYVFYSLLVKKLPKLKIDDYTDGLLDDIDFDKYRIVKEEERAIVLENEDTNVKPIPVGTGGGKPQPEMDALSSIVKDFNDTYGNIEWKNRDEVQRQIEELPARIAISVDFANAVRNGNK